MPASLLIIGSGAIGAEFASLYRDLGTEVTLVEALPGILGLYGYSFLMIAAAIAGLVLICVYRGKLLWYKAPQELPKGTRFKAALVNGGMIALVLGCLILIVLSLFA